MGRNKKSADDKKDGRICIPFNKKDLAEVDKRVKELKMKRTEYLRYLIQSDLLGASIDAIKK